MHSQANIVVAYTVATTKRLNPDTINLENFVVLTLEVPCDSLCNNSGSIKNVDTAPYSVFHCKVLKTERLFAATEDGTVFIAFDGPSAACSFDTPVFSIGGQCAPICPDIVNRFSPAYSLTCYRSKFPAMCAVFNNTLTAHLKDNFTGRLCSYGLDGAKCDDYKYKKGVKHGTWTATGTVLQTEGTYVNGQLEGIVHSRDPKTGVVIKSTMYVKGKKNGKSLAYYPNGLVQLKCHYNQDVIHGKYREYADDASNTLKLSGTFTNGVKTGVWKTWRETVPGILHCIKKCEYDETGKLLLSAEAGVDGQWQTPKKEEEGKNDSAPLGSFYKGWKGMRHGDFIERTKEYTIRGSYHTDVLHGLVCKEYASGRVEKTMYEYGSVKWTCVV